MGSPDDPEPEFDLLERTDERGEPELDVFEKTEHEPEEYDPEAELYDSSTDSLTVPEVSTGEMDAPAEVQKAFWSTVLVLNGAILTLALGVMLIGFEGRIRDGGVLLGGGIVLCGFVLRRYRAFERTQKRGGVDANDEDGTREADEHGETTAHDGGEPK